VPYPDEEGPFRVDGLAEGYVSAAAESVRPGSELELVLEMRPAIEGVVRAPVKGRGEVRLYTEDRVLTVPVAADGSFRFDDLDEGPVTVQAEVAPYGAVEQSFYLQAGTLQRLRLRIREKNVIAILGRLQFWPRTGKAWINGAPVAVLPSGSFTFGSAVIGTNEILVDAPGRALFRERFTVRTRGDLRHNFKLPAEAVIRGRVRGAKRRRPVAGAEVRVGVDFSNPRNREALPLFPVEQVPVVHTDRDGRFEIRRLDKRLIYLVGVVADGYGQYVGEALGDGGPVNLLLPEGPFLFGKLKGIGGVPRDAVVSAVPLEETSEELRFNVEAWNRSRGARRRDGFYGLSGLVPGNYLVRVDAPGYGSVETVVDLNAGPRVRLDMRLRRGADLEDEDAELLQRLPPAIYEAGDASETNKSTLLQILVPDGLPGLRIRFFKDDEEFAPPMEFFEKKISLVGLPEATYRAIFTHPSLKKPLVKEDLLLERGKPVTLALDAR